jgi:hypothetical protein
MIATNVRPTRPWINAFRRCLPLLGLAPLACGDSRRNAEVGRDLGKACGEEELVADGAVEIDEDTTECDGVCLRGPAVAPPGTTSAGQCSCRCDGPAGTGPFCACASGFVCEHQLDDLGLGGSELAGSYCVRER